jgi:hypothetical protein
MELHGKLSRISTLASMVSEKAADAIIVIENAIVEKAKSMSAAERRELINKVQKKMRDVDIQRVCARIAALPDAQTEVKETRHVADVVVRHHCRVCFAPAFSACGKCRLIPYCSSNCQRIDWPRHKLLCISPDSKCAKIHVELIMESWSLCKVQKAIDDGRISIFEYTHFAQQTRKSGVVYGVTPMLSIAVNRGHVRMVEYLASQYAAFNARDAIKTYRCECFYNVDESDLCDVLDCAMMYLSNVAYRAIERVITRERFVLHVRKMTRCLQAVFGTSRNRRRDFKSLNHAINSATFVDTISAIFGFRTNITTVISNNGEYKSDSNDPAMGLFVHLYSMEQCAKVKIRIADVSEERFIAFVTNPIALSLFALFAIERLVKINSLTPEPQCVITYTPLSEEEIKAEMRAMQTCTAPDV